MRRGGCGTLQCARQGCRHLASSLKLLRGRTFAESREVLTSAEENVIRQEMPPRELLQQVRTRDAAPSNVDSEDTLVPGDTFGIMRNRCVFYRPVPREVHGANIWGELFPPGSDPMQCFSPRIVRQFTGRFGLSEREAVKHLRDAEGDINEALRVIEISKKGSVQMHGYYGLVALEVYSPEVFCFVSFHCPTFEATRDDDVLDAIHEIALSVAELPVDTPPRQLVDRANDWETEDGQRIGDLLKAFDMSIAQIVLLPFGDYSTQGFHVLQPVKPETPNIGIGGAACCMDLRTGIHKRFRFHIEKCADSVSEHIVQEALHFGQIDTHMFRQAYWFRPEYSVEEFVRFKESLLQPSASIFEMRTGTLLHPFTAAPGYRNIIEVEKLKVLQHKHEKHYEDYTTPGQMITADRSQLQTVVAGGGGSSVSGGAAFREGNSPGVANNSLETQAGPMRKALTQSLQSHGDRAFERFYRNNFH
jgi:hypothetical protein